MKEDSKYEDAYKEMLRLFESFLNNNLRINESNECTLGVKIEKYKEKEPSQKEIVRLMFEISRGRNGHAHITSPGTTINNLDDFKKFHKPLIRLSNLLLKKNEIGLENIMIPTLKYDMANAGDIIKHGLIAEFCEWWFEEDEKLIFSDSFGGCPWGWFRPSYEWFGRVEDRMNKIKESNGALGRVYHDAFTTSQPDYLGADKTYPKYLGSSHLVKAIAKNKGKTAHISASDKDEDARYNLKNSGLRLIKDFDDYDGYKIIDDGIQENYGFNLILIDPYAEFLLEELKSKNQRLHRIKDFVEKHNAVYVAVVILDMKDNFVRKNFFNFWNKFLKEISVSLRCPKIGKEETKIKGESGFNSEILLISKQFEENPSSTSGLKERLEKFATEAEKILPLTSGQGIEFHHNDRR